MYTHTLGIKGSMVALKNKCKNAIVNILAGQKLYIIFVIMRFFSSRLAFRLHVNGVFGHHKRRLIVFVWTHENAAGS